MTIDRDKYIVFKRQEFQEMMSLLALPPWTDQRDGSLVGKDWLIPPFIEQISDEVKDKELVDAVVIRKKDPFAASALHAYASSILTTIELLKISGVNGDLADRLLKLADYFSGEADDATFGLDGDRKIPD